MKTLEYKTRIKASKKAVWETMLGPETYKQWVGVSWPNSYYEGEWKEGTNLKFLSSEGGGTLARVVRLEKYDFIDMEHIAILTSDMTEDRTSEFAKGWIGSRETYSFKESDGETELNVTIKTAPEWEKMFDDGWPNALVALKEICENA